MNSPVLTEFTGRSGQILERLNKLYPSLIDLSLSRLKRLLNDLENPERHLPPTIHVAGTNGKGSTCSFLRAIGEKAGWNVHVSTSPHLINVTERFRISGHLIDEAELSDTLSYIEKVNNQQPITVFEVLTAATFCLFAKYPADLAIIEVGLGGRFDATNVIYPIASTITSISMDHEAFLGNSLVKIAREKSGIIKKSIPVITYNQSPEVLNILQEEAQAKNAPLFIQGKNWTIEKQRDYLVYNDSKGTLQLPLPSLMGFHQVNNAGLAIATLRATQLAVPEYAWQGIAEAQWPARLQRLQGTLTRYITPETELWLDGGHNADAGQILARFIKSKWQDRPLHLIVGMKNNKDSSAFLAPLIPLCTSIQAVIEPDQHMAMSIDNIIQASKNHAISGGTIKNALIHLQQTEKKPYRVLICGSLYLAGSVLRQDGWKPV